MESNARNPGGRRSAIWRGDIPSLGKNSEDVCRDKLRRRVRKQVIQVPMIQLFHDLPIHDFGQAVEVRDDPVRRKRPRDGYFQLVAVTVKTSAFTRVPRKNMGSFECEALSDGGLHTNTMVASKRKKHKPSEIKRALLERFFLFPGMNGFWVPFPTTNNPIYIEIEPISSFFSICELTTPY